MSPRSGHYEALLKGKTIGDAGKYVPVDVKFTWSKHSPLSITILVIQPALGPDAEWTFSLELIREVFQVGAFEAGDGDVKFVRRGTELRVLFSSPEGDGVLILQAGAVAYILPKIGLPPVAEQLTLDTAVDVLLTEILGHAEEVEEQ